MKKILAVIIEAIMWIGLGVCALLVLQFLTGCVANKPLTSAQIATTRPVAHPVENIETVVEHVQTTLMVVNIPAFLATLVGIALMIVSLIEADTMLEHLGMAIAVICGCVTLGTLAAVLTVPWIPWIAGGGFLAGAGYGAYLLYEKFFGKKSGQVAVSVVNTK